MFIRLILIALLLGGIPVVAQSDDLPPAEIVNAEGGPQVIRGEVNYTNTFFTAGVAEPLVILEDQAGFVDRNRGFVLPPESQVLGQITSDFFTSPFTYTLQLPLEPQGTLRDVDNDGETDTGVQIFGIAYWTNIWGPSFLEERDLGGGGWSTAYASMRTSTHSETQNEVIGGKYLIYSPDDQQGFPNGFGEDGLLFTDDDPTVSIPQGYTVVDLDTDPFTFDRSEEVTVDLIEGEGAEADDFSALSYPEAFDAMVEKFRNEYAFTEYYNLDWDALEEEFRPSFERADTKNDPQIYFNNLREFIWRVPDGHVSAQPLSLFIDSLRFNTATGIGINIREIDDGRALVTFLLEGSPAAEEGMQLGTEIVAFDGRPITDIIDAAVPWTQPFSTEHNLRLAKMGFATRFAADKRTVEVTYRNPDSDEEIVAEIETSNEIETLRNALTPSDFTLTGFETPVAYELLPSGYGYVAIYSFSDNSLLAIQLWERMIQNIKAANVPGLILDLRQNGGGSGFLADQMAAYFFNSELVVGQRGQYSEELGEFYFDERGVEQFYLPSEDLRYEGPLVVLVGPSCASACERIAYDLTLQDRATIVGQYPTAGLGGSIQDFLMPEGVTIRFTTGRSVDADGNIHIEGKGIAPDIDVPVNEETLFSDGDPILEAAVNFLNEATSQSISDEIVRINVGDRVEGEFSAGERIRYVIDFEAGVPVDIFVGSEDNALTTVVRFYDPDGNLVFSNEQQQSTESGSTFIAGLTSDVDITVILEVATFADASAGMYVLSITES